MLIHSGLCDILVACVIPTTLALFRCTLAARYETAFAVPGQRRSGGAYVDLKTRSDSQLVCYAARNPGVRYINGRGPW